MMKVSSGFCGVINFFIQKRDCINFGGKIRTVEPRFHDHTFQSESVALTNCIFYQFE